MQPNQVPMSENAQPLAAAVTQTTTTTAAGVSVGVETTRQLTESLTGVLSSVSMVVATFAGVVAIISAGMNYKINKGREKRERLEHQARMDRYKKAP